MSRWATTYDGIRLLVIVVTILSPPVGSQCTTDCNTIGLTFIIQATGAPVQTSVQSNLTNFGKIKEFLNDVSTAFQDTIEATTYVLLAESTYLHSSANVSASNVVKSQIKLKEFANITRFHEAVNELGGDGALEASRSGSPLSVLPVTSAVTSQLAAANEQDLPRKHVVFVLDGLLNDTTSQLSLAHQRMKDGDITATVIGIGNANAEQLIALAGNDSDLVYSVDDHGQLPSLVSNLTEIVWSEQAQSTSCCSPETMRCCVVTVASTTTTKYQAPSQAALNLPLGAPKSLGMIESRGFEFQKVGIVIAILTVMSVFGFVMTTQTPTEKGDDLGKKSKSEETRLTQDGDIGPEDFVARPMSSSDQQVSKKSSAVRTSAVNVVLAQPSEKEMLSQLALQSQNNFPSTHSHLVSKVVSGKSRALMQEHNSTMLYEPGLNSDVTHYFTLDEVVGADKVVEIKTEKPVKTSVLGFWSRMRMMVSKLTVPNSPPSQPVCASFEAVPHDPQHPDIGLYSSVTPYEKGPPEPTRTTRQDYCGLDEGHTPPALYVKMDESKNCHHLSETFDPDALAFQPLPAPRSSLRACDETGIYSKVSVYEQEDLGHYSDIVTTDHLRGNALCDSATKLNMTSSRHHHQFARARSNVGVQTPGAGAALALKFRNWFIGPSH